MKHLATAVDRQFAWAKLTRRSRLAAWFGWFDRWRPARRAERLQASRIELIYLPAWLITYSGSRQGVLVDGFTGTARISILSALRYEQEDIPSEHVPPWNSARAIETAADAILKTRLNQRTNYRAVSTTESHAELVGYPYWAYYFARPTGMLDAKLLDAVTGELAGPKMKPALIAALAGRRPAQ